MFSSGFYMLMFRCCVSNLIIGSFHRLRLGFIFDEFRTLLTVCS